MIVLIDGPSDANPWGREALILDGQKVGRLTSGGYMIASGKQIGIGYVRRVLAVTGQKLHVHMQCELWNAEIVEESPYDPENATIRVDGCRRGGPPHPPASVKKITACSIRYRFAHGVRGTLLPSKKLIFGETHDHFDHEYPADNFRR